MEFVWKDDKKNNDSRWDQHEYPLSHKLTPCGIVPEAGMCSPPKYARLHLKSSPMGSSCFGNHGLRNLSVFGTTAAHHGKNGSCAR